jgi:hypothetical protein
MACAAKGMGGEKHAGDPRKKGRGPGGTDDRGKKPAAALQDDDASSVPKCDVKKKAVQPEITKSKCSDQSGQARGAGPRYCTSIMLDYQ